MSKLTSCAVGGRLGGSGGAGGKGSGGTVGGGLFAQDELATSQDGTGAGLIHASTVNALLPVGRSAAAPSALSRQLLPSRSISSMCWRRGVTLTSQDAFEGEEDHAAGDRDEDERAARAD